MANRDGWQGTADAIETGSDASMVGPAKDGLPLLIHRGAPLLVEKVSRILRGAGPQRDGGPGIEGGEHGVAAVGDGGHNGCHGALVLGRTRVGERVYDVDQALDYLWTRDDMT